MIGSPRPARPRRTTVHCNGPSLLATGRRPQPPAPVLELAPLPTSETNAWSRGLWGRFLPDRRAQPRSADAAA